MRILALFAFLVPCLASAAESSKPECGFMDEATRLLEETAPETAAREELFGKGQFLSIGSGRTPSRPGFATDRELDCVIAKYEFAMVWLGADVIMCEGQIEMAVRMDAYAEAYNQTVKSMLIEAGAYQCA